VLAPRGDEGAAAGGGANEGIGRSGAAGADTDGTEESGETEDTGEIEDTGGTEDTGDSGDTGAVSFIATNPSLTCGASAVDRIGTSVTGLTASAGAFSSSGTISPAFFKPGSDTTPQAMSAAIPITAESRSAIGRSVRASSTSGSGIASGSRMN